MSKSSPLLVIWWPLAAEQNRAEEEGRVPLVHYAVYSTTGKRLNHGDEALNQLPNSMPCLVLANPSEVTLLTVTPPKVSGKKLLDALPFLVEPQLLNDPEENFLALHSGLIDSSTEKLVSVIAKTRVRAIAAGCKQFKLKLIGISCESLIATTQPQAWVTQNHLLVTDQLAAPLALDLNQNAVIYPLLAKRAQLRESQPTLAPVPAVGSNDQAQLAPWIEAGLLGAQTVDTPDLTTLLKKPLCTTQELARLGLKVDQGSFHGVKELVSACLVFAVVAIVGLNALAYKTYSDEQALRDDIESTFKRALPDTPMVADPLLLLARARNELTKGTQTTNTDGMAYLLHEIGLALDDAPFNSLTSAQWIDSTLLLTFNPNVTVDIQETALRKLKGKPIKAQWVVGDSQRGPILKASWSRR